MKNAASARFHGWIVALAWLAVLFPVVVFALDYPLQPEEVEQAYSLGRTTNHEELADFLKKYEHDFQYPSDNPIAYVTSIEFQTPYEQVVLKSFQSTQYDKFKAAEDYRAGAGAVFVRVVVALRRNLSGPVPAPDSFQVTVSQREQMNAVNTTTRVLCDPYNLVSPYGGPDSCQIYMREILLRFNHGQFGPGKVTVKVLLPQDKSLETQFNLSRLK